MRPQSALLIFHFCATGAQLCIGQQAAFEQVNRMLMTYMSAATTAALCLPILALTNLEAHPHENSLSLPVGASAFLILGAAFSASSYARLRAQSSLPTWLSAPLFRTSLLLVTTVSILFFGEKRPEFHLIAIFLAFVSLSFIRPSASLAHPTHIGQGISWALLSAICVSGLQIGSKLLLDARYGYALPPLIYIVAMNTSTCVVTSIPLTFQTPSRAALRRTVALGVSSGLLNILSVGSLSVYLVSGDASIVYPIGALAAVIPTLFFSLTGRESPPRGRSLAAYAVAFASFIALLLPTP